MVDTNLATSAPENLLSSCPFRINTKVGSELILKELVILASLSVSTLINITCRGILESSIIGAFSLAIRLNSGAIRWQGPHLSIYIYMILEFISSI